MCSYAVESVLDEESRRDGPSSSAARRGSSFFQRQNVADTARRARGAATNEWSNTLMFPVPKDGPLLEPENLPAYLAERGFAGVDYKRAPDGRYLFRFGFGIQTLPRAAAALARACVAYERRGREAAS